MLAPFPQGLRAWAAGWGLLAGAGVSAGPPSLFFPDGAWGTSDLPSHCPSPPAAQEARNKFEDAERSLRDMQESIR